MLTRLNTYTSKVVKGLTRRKTSRGPLANTAYRLLELALAIEEMERRDLLIPASVIAEANTIATTARLLVMIRS